MRPRVLVVKDDFTVMNFSSIVLEREGFVVLPARNVAEALESSETKSFDLLFTDVNLGEGINRLRSRVALMALLAVLTSRQFGRATTYRQALGQMAGAPGAW